MNLFTRAKKFAGDAIDTFAGGALGAIGGTVGLFGGSDPQRNTVPAYQYGERNPTFGRAYNATSEVGSQAARMRGAIGDRITNIGQVARSAVPGAGLGGAIRTGRFESMAGMSPDNIRTNRMVESGLLPESEAEIYAMPLQVTNSRGGLGSHQYGVYEPEPLQGGFAQPNFTRTGQTMPAPPMSPQVPTSRIRVQQPAGYGAFDYDGQIRY